MLLRVILLSCLFITTAAFAQTKYGSVGTVVTSEDTDGETFCGKIDFDLNTGWVTATLKKYILDDATVAATVDGKPVTDLVNEDTPGKALSGKKVQFPNGKASGGVIGIPFTVKLMSMQLAQAVADKKNVVIQVFPSNEMMNRAVRILRYPATSASGCK